MDDISNNITIIEFLHSQDHTVYADINNLQAKLTDQIMIIWTNNESADTQDELCVGGVSFSLQCSYEDINKTQPQR